MQVFVMFEWGYVWKQGGAWCLVGDYYLFEGSLGFEGCKGKKM